MIYPLSTEIFLTILGLLSLIMGATRWRNSPHLVYGFLWTQVAILLWSIGRFLYVTQGGTHIISFLTLDGMLKMGGESAFCSFFLQGMAIVLAWMSKRSSQKSFALPIEFYGFLSATTVALILLTKAAHLGVFFITLEISSLFIALMIALGSPHSPKTALKYLLAAGVSALVLLWGIALVYAHGGALDYATLSAMPLRSPLALAGTGMIIVALLFKLGIFPFGYYLPEVYEGASLPVVGLLSTSSKLAAIAALWKLLNGPFFSLVPQLAPVLSSLLIVTLAWGALSALYQSSIKRLLSLSGMVHAAFILAGLLFAVSGVPQALGATIFYLLGYFPATLLFLYCLVEIDGSEATVDSLKELYRSRPGFSILMMIAIASMAGLPPLIGFMAKFIMMYVAASQAAWGLLAAMIVASVTGLYYYLRVVFALIGRQNEEPEHDELPSGIKLPLSTRIFAGSLAIWVVVCGLIPLPLGVWWH